MVSQTQCEASLTLDSLGLTNLRVLAQSLPYLSHYGHHPAAPNLSSATLKLPVDSEGETPRGPQVLRHVPRKMWGGSILRVNLS